MSHRSLRCYKHFSPRAIYAAAAVLFGNVGTSLIVKLKKIETDHRNSTAKVMRTLPEDAKD